MLNNQAASQRINRKMKKTHPKIPFKRTLTSTVIKTFKTMKESSIPIRNSSLKKTASTHP
jgi:hypothetical protein